MSSICACGHEVKDHLVGCCWARTARRRFCSCMDWRPGTGPALQTSGPSGIEQPPTWSDLLADLRSVGALSGGRQ